MSIALARRRALMNMVKVEEAEGNPIVFNTNTVRGFAGLRLYGASEQVTTTGAQLIDKIVVGNVLKSSNEKVVCTITNEGLHIKTFSGVSITSDNDIYFFGNENSNVESGYVECLEAGKYTVSIQANSGFRCYVVAWRNSKSVTIAETTEKSTFNVSENDKLRIFIRPTSASVFETMLKYIINKGSTSLPYEPYTGGQPSPSTDYPQDWTNKGEIGQINTEIYGGNLCSGFLDNGNVKCASFLKYTGKITIAMRKKTGSKQMNCRFWYSNGTKGDDIYVILPGSPNDIWVQTTKDVVDCTGVSFYEKGSSGEENAGVEAIVKLGEYTITDYEPYKLPQSLIVQTPNGLPGIPVSSGGNYTDENGQQWVADYVDFETGEYVQCVKKRVLNNDDADSFKLNRETDTMISYGYSWKEDTSNITGIISNHFKNEYPFKCSVRYGQCWLDFEPKSLMPTLDDLKTFLKNNQVEILFILKTPIHTPLPSEQIQAFKSLHANSPTTTILNDSDVWMEATYKVKR